MLWEPLLSTLPNVTSILVSATASPSSSTLNRYFAPGWKLVPLATPASGLTVRISTVFFAFVGDWNTYTSLMSVRPSAFTPGASRWSAAPAPNAATVEAMTIEPAPSAVNALFRMLMAAPCRWSLSMGGMPGQGSKPSAQRIGRFLRTS